MSSGPMSLAPKWLWGSPLYDSHCRNTRPLNPFGALSPKVWEWPSKETRALHSHFDHEGLPHKSASTKVGLFFGSDVRKVTQVRNTPALKVGDLWAQPYLSQVTHQAQRKEEDREGGWKAKGSEIFFFFYVEFLLRGGKKPSTFPKSFVIKGYRSAT